MRKLIVIVSLIGCLSAVAGFAPVSAAQMRGLWVDAWNPGFKTPQEATEMVAKAKSCGFNALFVQVRKRGDVYYRSKIEPMASDVAPGYDPLADVISKAHAAKMQVHAWVVVYEVYHDSKWNTSDARQVHVKHPEWLMKNERGETVLPGERVYLDPGIPEVRTYLASIVQEIVDGYNVDGVHLDWVRYPCRDAGYNETSLAAFAKEYRLDGKPRPEDANFCAWRRQQVTDFVKLAQKAVHSKRGVSLSVAGYGNRSDAFDHRMQDWPGWLDAGIVDFVVPMAFAKQNKAFEAMTKEAVRSAKGRPIYIGQGGWLTNASQGMEQIRAALGSGAGGTVIYSYAACSKPFEKESVSLMDALKADVFAKGEDAPGLAH